MIRDDAVIVELKYDQQYDPAATKISREFPFRLSKHSKYVQGVMLTYR